MTHRLSDPHNSLLLVVDIQEKFIPVLHEGERLLEKAAILIKAATELGVPIVLSEQYPKGLGQTAGSLKTLLSNSATILEKTAFGCLEDTTIEAHIRGLERKQVVVCGIEAHVCVNQTVHQLLSHGYEVHLVQDAVTSRHKKNLKTGMAKMLQSGAIPTCVEMLLFEWMRDASHPQFRTLQALVK